MHTSSYSSFDASVVSQYTSACQGELNANLFFSDSAAAMHAEVRKNSSHRILDFFDWHTMVSSSNISHADEVLEHELLHCGV